VNAGARKHQENPTCLSGREYDRAGRERREDERETAAIATDRVIFSDSGESSRP
jgi:hypothetical protein